MFITLKKLGLEKTADKPGWIVIRGFLLAIIIGAFMLSLPFASADGRWLSPLKSIFTATSAVCVTGLTVVDTGTEFSFFGQMIILILMQLGGLGLVTMGTLFLLLVGKRLSFKNEFVLMDSFGQDGIRGLRALIVRVFVYAVMIEAAGASILAHRLIRTYDYSLAKAIYYGIFHAVSAFCNAGFALYSDSLIGFRDDNVILLCTACLIVLGGLGFPVLYNIVSVRFWHRNRLTRGRLSLHSRAVLVASAVLIVVGTISFFLLEYGNTLSEMSLWDRITCSFFQAVTPRTAGFNVVDMGVVQPSTLFMTMVLMFIGGAPASAAGGIKITTMVVLIFTIKAMVRGREDTELSNRTVPMKIVREAISIFLLGFLFVGFVFGVLLVTERSMVSLAGVTLSDRLLFETVSAFGTVGLSTGITTHLSVLGQICIIICMFVGRLGSLTVALFIGTREVGQTVRYPEEDIVVG